jgi:hypothetical protein
MSRSSRTSVIQKCCRPPLWSSGQSSWLQIQRSRFDSPHYQIFWEVVVLEWGLLSPVSTIEELLGKICSGSGLENREYGRRDPSRWPRDTLYLQKLALTSPTSGCRSVGIVHSQTEAMEFSFFSFYSAGVSSYFNGYKNGDCVLKMTCPCQNSCMKFIKYKIKCSRIYRNVS